MGINVKFTLSVTCSVVFPYSRLFTGQRGSSRPRFQYLFITTGSFIRDSCHIILFK